MKGVKNSPNVTVITQKMFGLSNFGLNDKFFYQKRESDHGKFVKRTN
jgi:hypothetical protein